MNKSAELFFAFLRLGLTSFGGPAMIAYIRELAVTRRKWLDEAEFRNGVVLCQSIPGATAMQVAAFAGLKVHGLSGALASYVGFGLPAFLIMLTLSALFAESRSLPLLVSIFNGLQVAVVALMFNAVYSFGRGIKRDAANLSFVLAAAVLFWSGASPFLVILLSALAGTLLMKVELSPAPGNNNQKALRIDKGVWVLALLLVSGLIILFIADDKLFELAAVMLQVDIFAFGGGFSSLPLMLQKVVNVHGWMSSRTFMDGIALGQITPGPIVITATFVGYLLKGMTGAVVATVAIFTPSFLVLVAVEPMFSRFRNSRYFLRAMDGVFACFVGLLLFVGIKFLLDVPWEPFRAVLGLAVFAALIRKIDILVIVIISAIISAFVL